MKPTQGQLDALKEIVNIGVGRAASSLNQMLSSHIDLDVPAVHLFRPDDFSGRNMGISEDRVSCVRLSFEGNIAGHSLLVFPPESAIALVSMMTGEEPGSLGLDAVMEGTLTEVGNILMNGVIGAIGNMLACYFDFSLPIYIEGGLKDLLYSEGDPQSLSILLVVTRFKVHERQINGNIFIIFELASFNELLSSLQREIDKT